MTDTVTVPVGDMAPAAELGNEQSLEGASGGSADTQLVEIDGKAYTLADVKSNMLMHADYTRKTQEVASERQRLAQAEAVWSAIQEDPAGSIAALQEHFAAALTPAAPAETADPEDEFKAEVKSFMQERRQQELVSTVNAELTSLQVPQQNWEGVLQHALSYNIGDLGVAWRDYQAVNGATQRSEADAAALAAKQGLPAVAGGSSAAGATRAGSGKLPPSFGDALRDTLAENGVASVTSLLR